MQWQSTTYATKLSPKDHQEFLLVVADKYTSFYPNVGF